MPDASDKTPERRFKMQPRPLKNPALHTFPSSDSEQEEVKEILKEILKEMVYRKMEKVEMDARLHPEKYQTNGRLDPRKIEEAKNRQEVALRRRLMIVLLIEPKARPDRPSSEKRNLIEETIRLLRRFKKQPEPFQLTSEKRAEIFDSLEKKWERLEEKTRPVTPEEASDWLKKMRRKRETEAIREKERAAANTEAAKRKALERKAEAYLERNPHPSPEEIWDWTEKNDPEWIEKILRKSKTAEAADREGEEPGGWKGIFGCFGYIAVLFLMVMFLHYC